MLESIIISTLAGSIVCSALLIFKNKILSLLGGKALYYISLIAMLVFILPMNIGDISLPKVPVNQPINVTEFEATVPEPNTDVAPTQNTPQEDPKAVQHNVLPQASNMVRRSNPITMQEILLAVWLLGFIISMCRYFISYFRFKKKICGFEAHEVIDGVEVIKSPLITSPLVFGFFKPTLAIPEIEMNEDDYNLAIKHEMVHYKHHDSWFKLFAVIVNSICWFNPITYFMVNLIGEACEYACDEQVTKEMDMTDKKQYSTMILSMVCQSSPALSSNMVKNKKQLKRRFEMIMKKKRFSALRTVLCTILMLALTCGSVVLANEVAPLVSSLLKDDYVYIANFGKGNYNGFVPTEKDGVYYLPWREFLNNSDVENDKIKYENGTVSVDIWSKTRTALPVTLPYGEENKVEDSQKITIPGKLVWSTSCTIGSKDVIIDGNKYTLANAPYLENGVTYVPYEYIKLLSNYEEIERTGAEIDEMTHTFTPLIKYGFDSMESRFYVDDIQIDNLPREKSVVDEGLALVYGYSCDYADVSLSKTGYRTEFSAKFNYIDFNNTDDRGTAELTLNKVTRIYSKGSDIEGLFTLKIDGETIYDNEKGYMTYLPLPSGEGIVHFGETIIKINQAKFRLNFFGYGSDSHDEYSTLSAQNREIAKKADTKMIGMFPTEAKLNGNVIRRTNKDNYFQYNIQDEYALLRFGFDDYNDENGLWMENYDITREENSHITVIDENTFSGHFFLENQNVRIDSFDAILTLLPDNKFEFRSNDGKYIVRGTTDEFVPQWQWSEEQKMSYPPQVVMIDE
ncbi:MAG: hypothetical protein E7400_01135 [Ruminococcaceae bacterium]|nr:hypothetical protein [Oscillospiraceae bacterium]